jgi:hypothetical protein
MFFFIAFFGERIISVSLIDLVDLLEICFSVWWSARCGREILEHLRATLFPRSLQPCDDEPGRPLGDAHDRHARDGVRFPHVAFRGLLRAEEFFCHAGLTDGTQGAPAKRPTAASQMSALMKEKRGPAATGWREARLPAWVSLSTTQTCAPPRAISWRVTAEPMKPAPPVGRMLAMHQSPDGRQQCTAMHAQVAN